MLRTWAPGKVPRVRTWTVSIVLVAAALSAAGCGSAKAPAAAPPAPESMASSAAVTDRLVDIGDGRVIKVVCAGEGSPTVVLIPGSQESHQAWQVVASGDPADPYVTSDESVFALVGRQTRVCSYDRPGVPLLDGSLSDSTLVPQPTTAQQGADDVAAWLAAAGEPGPYVVVAHSW